MKQIPSPPTTHTAAGEYIVIGLTLEHSASQSLASFGTDYTLVDGKGTRYYRKSIIATEWAKRNDFTSGLLTVTTEPLPPRSPTTWGLIFDVESGAQQLRLLLPKSQTTVQIAA